MVVNHMPGDKVVLKGVESDGVVTEMTIKAHGYVCYTVVYWIEGCRNEEVVEGYEIESADDSKEQTSVERRRKK